MSTHGIKETEEALEAVLLLGLMFWKSFHDGFQISDLAVMWDTYKNDENFNEAMQTAFEGYKKIPSEIKDLQLEEAVALSGVMINYLPKYLRVIK